MGSRRSEELCASLRQLVCTGIVAGKSHKAREDGANYLTRALHDIPLRVQGIPDSNRSSTSLFPTASYQTRLLELLAY
ncbi:hypothetical protein FA13DRAFT_1743142 [Coprinellus micaceus]|uniref:Uncharacterized protein n=1 Tax=Coprinellus micaceus TaxID=71717 RepID=A0A4Y7SGT7_COPMI|nr:hypothetical protein FA13DRAFT_1743142 [Coprinellus micaceus]